MMSTPGCTRLPSLPSCHPSDTFGARPFKTGMGYVHATASSGSALLPDGDEAPQPEADAGAGDGADGAPHRQVGDVDGRRRQPRSVLVTDAREDAAQDCAD